jgi:hypothetical protein
VNNGCEITITVHFDPQCLSNKVLHQLSPSQSPNRAISITRCGSEDEGPSLQGISDRAGDRVPELSAAEYIHQSIMEPRAFVVEGYANMGLMNSYLLSEEEVDDLVAFLLTQ